MKKLLLSLLIACPCVMFAQGFVNFGVPTVISGSSGSAGVTTTNASIPPIGWSAPTFTTNNLPPLGSPEWSDQGYPTVGYWIGNEFVFNVENGNNYGSSCLFAVPDGTTNVAISFYARTTVGTSAQRFRLMYAGGGNNVAVNDATLTTTQTNIVFNASASDLVTASTNLMLNLYRQSTNFYLISNLTVSFSCPTDPIFSGPTARYQVELKNIMDNAQNLTPSAELGKVNKQDRDALTPSGAAAHSYVTLVTDAPYVAFEISTFGNTASLGVSPNTVYVDGVLATNFYAGVNGVAVPPYVFKTLNVGTTNQWHTIQFYNSYVQIFNYANALRSVTVPCGNRVFMQEKEMPKIFFVGDSILNGGVGPTNAFNTVQKTVERYMGMSSINLAQGGQALITLMTNSSTPNGANKRNLIRALAEYKPAVVYTDHGLNDITYGVSAISYTTNEFNRLALEFLDTVHFINPSAIVYWQGMITNVGYGFTGTNAAGQSVVDFRNTISNACVSRSAFAKFVDGNQWLNSGDLSDGTHPSPHGAVKYASYITRELWTNRFAVTPNLNYLPQTPTAPIPIAGTVIQWNSNNVIYGVSTTKTNFIVNLQ